MSVAEALLKAGANAECKTIPQEFDKYRSFCGGKAPIHWAAVNGHEALVKLLLDHGAIASPMNITLRTPLQEAIMQGHRSVIRILIERGALLNTQDENGWKPMHEVVSRWGGDINLTRYLLNQKPSLEIANSAHDGELTPLLLAIRRCHVEIVNRLLGAGADLHARSISGETALHIANWHDTMG